MKLGIAVPQSLVKPKELENYLVDAEESGVEFAFFFDHLWQVNQPGSDALDSMVASSFALSVTSTLNVGTLVTRVGLRSYNETLSELFTLLKLSKGRFIPGLGVGDRASLPEENAYGISSSRLSRLKELENLLDYFVTAQTKVIIGGNQLIQKLKSKYASTIIANYWEVSAKEIKEIPSKSIPITVAVRLPKKMENDAIIAWANQYKQAGVSLLIILWPRNFEVLHTLKEHL